MSDQLTQSEGSSESEPGKEHSTTPESPGLVDKLNCHITKFAGVDKLDGFSIKELFSSAFSRHTTEEIEEYFSTGIPSTTPAIGEVDTSWPKPWVFFRAFVISVLVYLGFVMGWKEFGNINLVPGMIMVGSFAVPFSTLIFFVEVNVRKNISLYQILRLLLLGSTISLMVSLSLFEMSYKLELGWLGASVAGLVEEPGKLLALLMVVYIPKYKYTLNGLLFGAAIGAGYAAFESAGYALYYGINYSTDLMLDNIMLRGMLSPFAHIAWTGMCGAALWKVKGNSRFVLSMVKDSRFVRVFVIAVVLHMLWNIPVDPPFYLKYVVLGVVAWIVIFAQIQDGLKQLREEQQEAKQMPGDGTD